MFRKYVEKIWKYEDSYIKKALEKIRTSPESEPFSYQTNDNEDLHSRVQFLFQNIAFLEQLKKFHVIIWSVFERSIDAWAPAECTDLKIFHFHEKDFKYR